MTLETQLTPPPLETGKCAECGVTRQVADLVPFARCFVCAECKPNAIRKVTTGLPIGTMWRKGTQLIAFRGVAFPNRCVKCNCAVDDKRLVRKLSWHHPLIYLLLLFSPLVYLLAAVCTRKNAEVLIPLCDAHRAKRRNAILTAWGIFAASVCAFVAAAALSNGWLVLPGAILLLTSMIWGVIGGRVIVAQKITGERVHLGGICGEFLAELPDWAV